MNKLLIKYHTTSQSNNR